MFKREILTGELICLSLTNMFFWAGIDIFLPILPQYFHTQGLSTFEVGIVLGAMAVGGMLFRVIAGRAVDRYGTAIVASIGLIIALAGTCGYFGAKTLGLAVACSFAQGVGLACFSPAAVTMATLMHSEEYTTDVFAVYTLMGMLGASVATALANALYGQMGMFGVTEAGAAFIVASLLFIPKRPTVRVSLTVAAARPVREIAANPGVYIPTLSTLATNICFAGAMTFLPMLMLSRAVADFNSFFVSYAIVVIIVRLFVRQICEKFGVLRLEWWSVMLIGLAMLVAVGAYDWLALTLCGVITGLSFGVAFPAMGTTVTNHTEPENRGTAFGIFTTAADIGFVLGATGLSCVAAIWGYPAVFMLAGAYTLLYGVFHKLWLAGKLQENQAWDNC